MLRKHKFSVISSAVFAVVAMSAHAQTGQLERVEITGSSIKRIASEGALPVQVITAKEIMRSGATTVADIIQKLPSMQGFTIADISVGSNSGGIVTASIHDIGESYTLVLLNGRRVAPTGSGSRVNLNAIPMSAIERIEVLTDGASALYGSDAIAGVVNFVLKKNAQGGNVTATANVPLEGGARSANASISYGVGDLDKDKFSLMVAYRHDEQKQLKATERDFGSTAYLPFEWNGTKYVYDRTSTFASPANATVTFNKLADGTTLPAYSFNPYRKKTGACAERNFYSLNNAVSATSVTESCAFDFANTIEIFPENKRDSLFLSGRFKVSDQLSFFSDVAYSRFDLTARIAANPVPVAIPTTSVYYTNSVLPYLTPTQAANVKTVSASYRAQDFGTRDSQSVTDSKHFVAGVDAEFGGWNLNSGFTWSQNAIDERYVGGYFRDKEFRDMVKNVAFDPFALAGTQSAATMNLISQSIFNGTVRTESTTLTGLDVRASRELFKVAGGDVSLGLGGDVRNYRYKQDPSAAAFAGEIYNYAAVQGYDLKRQTAGAFAELLVPIIKDVELTAAVRYDTTGAIDDAMNAKTVGERLSATTYKMSGRYQVSSALLFRGSFGTGFKAPSMLDLAQPQVPRGVTAASYDCPFPNTDACKPGKLQYSVLGGGNDQLKPETSKQVALGIRFEPNNDFGIGADFWEVKMKDAVSGVSEKQAFGDPQKYSSLFTTYKTPAETQPYYAFRSVSTNIGRTLNRGIDWDIVSRHNVAGGRLTLGLTGTYLLDSAYTRPGTDNDWTNSMGKYGENNAVSFRNVVRGTAIFDSGAFSNTLTINWRSGYTDVNQLVRNLSTNKNERVSIEVPDYTTVDWQGSYKFNKDLEVRVGIKNLLNTRPPLSLRDSSGHQVGYDARYADPILRKLYVTGNYNF